MSNEKIISLREREKTLEEELEKMMDKRSCSPEEMAAKAQEYQEAYKACDDEATKNIQPCRR
ncbi:MAG: hypothetical protein R3328_10425 [Planococcaceae bacterium]|nr:hypothetical protein [Planococcaceae bacterium]